MPFRTGRSYTVPGKGTTTRSKSGKAKTYSGSGAAPAGTTKVPEKSYTEVPTVTVTESSSGAPVVTTSGYGPSPKAQRAAKRAVRAQKRRARRVKRVVAETKREPSLRARARKSSAPRSYKAPKLPKPSKASRRYEPNPSKAVISSVPNPNAKPAVFKGMKTAGEPSRRELQKAAKSGTLRVNKQGFATTPRVRKVGGELRRLRSTARSSSAPLPGLGPEETKVARKVLGTGKKVGADRKELLAAAETGLVESGFKNYTNQAETDADSLGWRQERTSIYGSDATDPVKGALNFFSETKEQSGGTAGELAANVQRPAAEYRGRYDEVKPEAAALLRAFEQGGLKPAQRKQLRKVSKEAQKLGLKSAAPDLTPGKKRDVVYVRADAKGMVKWAEASVGTKEGTAKQTGWASLVGGVTDPWCAVFISAGLQRRGVPLPANVSHSESFLDPNWEGGTKLPTNDLSKAKPGDILVFDWGDGGETDHVALYKGSGRMVGGNESDEVQENDVPAESIVGIARPKYKGGKVAIKASTPLPSYTAPGTISSVPAGEAVSGAVGATGTTSTSGATAKGRAAKPKASRLQKYKRTKKALHELGVGESSTTTSHTSDSVLADLERKYLGTAS